MFWLTQKTLEFDLYSWFGTAAILCQQKIQKAREMIC